MRRRAAAALVLLIASVLDSSAAGQAKTATAVTAVPVDPAAATIRPASESPQAEPIDLPTVLQLAGAASLDVEIARQRLREAEGNRRSARWQFFPFLAPALQYQRHEGEIQNVEGQMLGDVDKQQYSAAAALRMQVDVGAAAFSALAAKQLVRAADRALDAERGDAVLAAASAYFDLVSADAAVGVAEEAERISARYHEQLERAVSIGVAFRGDELRVRTQKERDHIATLAAAERRRIAAARLATELQLDAHVDLVPRRADLAPLALPDSDAAPDALRERALASRPELARGEALVEAAQRAKQGVVYGPLVPSVGALASAGALGGGPDGGDERGGGSYDYAAGLSWRIGPGGLFDSGRIEAADARLEAARLQQRRRRDEILREVVEADTRLRSLRERLTSAQQLVATAEESWRLAEERKEFAVGVVLETLEAADSLTRARGDYLATIAEYDKAQYALSHAVGGLSGPRAAP